MSSKRHDTYCVFFPATGQKFPIRFMQTSDLYEVDLPAGTYGGEMLCDLKRELSAEFKGFRIVR